MIKAQEKYLRMVLDVLDRHQMVCKPTKASLFVKEVHSAGHVIGHGQRRPMPGKLAELTWWERPKHISELRSFMGFCHFYSGYIRTYTELSGPLHKMLQVGKFDGRRGSKKKLARTTEAEQAFEALNRTLLGKLGVLQHKRGESARRAKRDKTNNTQRQGPGHPGPETKESKRQRGRAENNNGEEIKKSQRGGGADKGPGKGQPNPGGG